MKILFDKCVPHPLKHDLTGHQVSTVREMGWNGIQNGALLTLAEGNFEVFLTVDRNMQYQQNLSGRSIAIIVCVGAGTRVKTLRPLMPKVIAALQTLQPGQVIIINP
jgi:predicted nuclease of predicted toxin-antitoxin system